MSEEEQPQELPPVAIRPENVNLSAVARELFQQHPDWTYEKINSALKLKTGKTLANSTLSRARLTGITNKLKYKHTVKGEMRSCADAGAIRQVMATCVTASDWQKITRKLVQMCVAGDLKAIDLLTNRLMGKPTEHLVEERRTTTLDLSRCTSEELDYLEAITLKAEGKNPGLTYVVEPEPEETEEDAEEETTAGGQ